VQIYSIQKFEGRNIYSHKPVIKLVINIGDYHKYPTRDIKGFNEKLLCMFPGLKQHQCSLGYEGGFADRLEEGTYIGHVTEHLILELEGLMGYEVSYGKTRIVTEPSLYCIIVQYANEICGVECCKAAVDIIDRLAAGLAVNVDEILNDIRKASVEFELGPSTRALYDEARKRGIPVRRIGNESLLQLGYGKNSRLVEAALTDAPSCISVDIAGNKHLTKELLCSHKIPVPDGSIAYTLSSALAAAREIGYPVAVKPLDGSQGRGVTLNLKNEEEVKAAYNEAVNFSKAVIIEKYIHGKDYRVLVVGGKVSSVCVRRPPFVTGDGKHSLAELIEAENSNPLRGQDHEKPMTKIKIDAITIQTLKRKGMSPEYVPREGEAVYLRENGNLSTGGTARECTSEIHPHNAMIAVKAAKVIGLDIAGVDITMEDISQPLNYGNGAVLEVNAAPGLRMHLFPADGQKSGVAADIMDMLYPEGSKSEIPLVSITGTNGKTTTTRLIAHTLAISGKKVGMTSTSGVYIDGKCVLKGDNTGPASARMVLADKNVEAAVLETARGGIVKKGLGYDLADVGVIVNISDDHLGIDGLHNLEDLTFVKALVVEAVKPDGYSVLNADDEMVEYLIGRASGNIMLFSMDKRNPILLNHVKNGGAAAYIEDGKIHICDSTDDRHIMRLEEIPITFEGRVDCNIENSLAAVCALFALKIPEEIIRAGLMTFKPDVASNPGRFNIFDMGDFKVMLDYSHNSAGYNAVAGFIEKMDATRLVGVVGIPGDRLDRNIKEVGCISAKVFSKIYIKEDRDLRGRQPGEVAKILYEAVIESGYKRENVEVIHSEIKALETAILDAQPGDLIVMLYEEFEPAVDLVNRFKQELEQNYVPEPLQTTMVLNNPIDP